VTGLIKCLRAGDTWLRTAYEIRHYNTGDYMECSICLGPLRHTRTAKRLSCGHEYHGACIDTWMQTGTTCPLCRHSEKRYKMSLTVEDLSSSQRTTSNVFTQEQILGVLMLLGVSQERFQEANFVFPPDSLDSIQAILRDLGLELDTSVLHTE